MILPALVSLQRVGGLGSSLRRTPFLGTIRRSLYQQTSKPVLRNQRLFKPQENLKLGHAIRR